MARYDRSYDYGMRGFADTTPPRFRGRPGGRYYGNDYDERSDPHGRMSNRVTARYNADYVFGGRGDPRPRNYHMYTGDRPDRMGGERYYRAPYMTHGGTRTSRGMTMGIGYDTDFPRAYDRDFNSNRDY